MKIAVIPTIRNFPWGAPGHCMSELVNALIQAGHEVLWLVAPIDFDRQEIKQLANRGVSVEPLPGPPPRYFRFVGIRKQFRKWRQSTRSLSEILTAFGPDHIFVNQGGTWCSLQDEFWDCLASRAGRYSLICHLNLPQPPFASAIFQRATQLITGSRKVYFGSAWTHRLTEFQIAANIPQATRFQCPIRFDFPAPLPWPNSGFPRLAMVNRLDCFHKGMDIAFQAVARLHQEGLRFSLNIYGTGADEDYLRQLARFLGIESVVSFSGYTSDLKEVWLEEEVLLLPSRFEGFAVSMIEAMGFGRPVIRTGYGGSEWIQDGVDGFICPAAEVGLLCETMRRAINMRVRWPEMGRLAHEKIRRDLDPNPASVFLKALEP